MNHTKANDRFCIYMFSEPFFYEQENLYIFFLDTSFSSSNNPENILQLSNMFTLVNLISSILIINCLGDITEHSLKNFGFINSLQENITLITEEKDSESKNEYLAYYHPKLLWVFRDHMEITDDKNDFCQYQRLHSFLNDPDTNKKINRHIKNLILDNYKDLDCLILSKPDFPFGKNKSWQKGVKFLKEKILQKVTTKSINGVKLNCRMFCSMIHSLIEELNENCLFNLNNALEYINENECITGYNNAIEKYLAGIKTHFETDEVKTMYNLISILKVMKGKFLY